MATGDAMSNYLENKLLDHELGGPDYTRPATLYFALGTAADDTGVTEIVGNGYARVAVTNNSTNFPAASGGSKTCAIDIQFPTATPSGWGTVTHVGYFDASSSGNLIRWAALPSSKTVAAGDAPKFAANALTFANA